MDLETHFALYWMVWIYTNQHLLTILLITSIGLVSTRTTFIYDKFCSFWNILEIASLRYKTATKRELNDTYALTTASRINLIGTNRIRERNASDLLRRFWYCSKGVWIIVHFKQVSMPWKITNIDSSIIVIFYSVTMASVSSHLTKRRFRIDTSRQSRRWSWIA